MLVRNGQSPVYTLRVDEHRGKIRVVALKRLDETEFRLPPHHECQSVQVSNEFVLLKTLFDAYWIRPLSTLAPIVLDWRRHVRDIQVDSRDTVCYMTADNMGRYNVLNIRVADAAAPVVHNRVGAYFLHDTWGPVIYSDNMVLFHTTGNTYRIDNISHNSCQFFLLHKRLFLFADPPGGTRNTTIIVEVFETHAVARTVDFPGCFEWSLTNQQVTDLKNGTAHVLYWATRAATESTGGILDLNTFIVTPSAPASSNVMTAVSDDGRWMMDYTHVVHSTTTAEQFDLKKELGFTMVTHVPSQGNWLLGWTRHYSNTNASATRSVVLVHWPTRTIEHTFPDCTDAVFVDDRVLYVQDEKLHWYSGHTSPFKLWLLLEPLKGHTGPHTIIGEYKAENSAGRYVLDGV